MEAKNRRLGNPKKMATFYLAVDTQNKLEESWMLLRTRLRERNISKSQIVEEAIKMVLDDLMKNKENSSVYKSLDKD